MREEKSILPRGKGVRVTRGRTFGNLVMLGVAAVLREESEANFPYVADGHSEVGNWVNGDEEVSPQNVTTWKFRWKKSAGKKYQVDWTCFWWEMISDVTQHAGMKRLVCEGLNCRVRGLTILWCLSLSRRLQRASGEDGRVWPSLGDGMSAVECG